MSRRLTMGIDAGGGGCRCLLVDLDASDLFVATHPWSFRPAPDTGGFGLDLDLEEIWRRIGEASREVMAAASASPDEVIGVCASSIRHGTVLLGRAGETLFAAPNRDSRASAEASTMAAEHGAHIARVAGHWPAPMFPAARLRWLATNHPELLEQAGAALSLSDWLTFWMTGEIRAERSQASETLLLDVATGAWSDELVSALGLPRALLPELVDAGSVVGALGAPAAAHLGLRAGVPVAAGAGDTQSALLGAGACMPGDVCAVAGTTTPVQRVLAEPRIASDLAWTSCHALPGRWVMEVNGGPTGDALDRVAALLWPDSPQPAAALFAEAAGHRGLSSVLSTLGAEPFRPTMLRLPVATLTLSPMDGGGGRAGVARGLVDGLAFGLAALVEQLVAASGGDPVSALKVVGGLSRSELFTQTAANAVGARVDGVGTPHVTALGAAMCAATGAEAFGDLAEASAALARPGRSEEPSDASTAERYRRWSGYRGGVDAVGDDAATLVLEAILAGREATGDAAPTEHRPRVLLTAEVDDASLEALREVADVEYSNYRDAGRLLAGDDLVEAAAGFDVFVTEIDVVDAEALARLPELRLVVCCRTNPVNVDVGACAAFGIPVLYTPGRNARAVAELAVTFALTLARKVLPSDRFLRDPATEAGDMGRMGMAHAQFVGWELGSRTVGLVGLGAVGRLAAQLLAPFGGRVVAFDPFVAPGVAAGAGAELVSLEQLLRLSDVVSLHAPVTASTRGMIGAEQLAMMKPGALLVNTARAALVDEAALADALRSGHLAGAAIDVFSVEPPGADHPLLQLAGVIATPHIGGNTAEVPAHQGRILLQELRRLLRGERPEFAVDPAPLEAFTWTGDRLTPGQADLEALVNRAGPAVTDIEAEEEGDRLAEATPPAPDPDSASEPSAADDKKPGFLGRLFGRRDKPADVAAEATASTVAPAAASAPASEAAVWMEAVARTFTERMLSDEAVTTFAKGKRIAAWYIASDVDVSFHMLFDQGDVSTGLGPPPRKPDVTIKMKAVTLDGIFAGTESGMKAAMSGRLSFTGNTVKAMSMQRLQGNVTRLYRESRDAVGAAPDLSAVPDAAPPATGTPAAGLPSAAPVLAASASAVQPTTLAGTLCKVVAELVDAGLITSTGGNVSVRDPDRPDQMLVTPSNLNKGDLRPDLMVRTDLAGEPIGDSTYAPTSEREIHGSVLAARPEVGAVIHSHAPHATVMAMAGLPFLPISTEAAFVGDIPVVPFIMPGTPELADAVVGHLGRGCAVLMQNHGLVVAGSSLRRAADLTYIIEHTAEQLVACHMLGKTPPLLPAETLEMLREIGELIA